jgi:hypothetical protein
VLFSFLKKAVVFIWVTPEAYSKTKFRMKVVFLGEGLGNAAGVHGCPARRGTIVGCRQAGNPCKLDATEDYGSQRGHVHSPELILFGGEAAGV